MKKRFAVLLLALALALGAAPAALANMAQPRTPDTGTTVTFEKNQEIAVLSEVLDITVTEDMARIRAQYTMQNTTGETVTTPAMFLCPNQEYPLVTQDGEELPFTTETYTLSYDSRVDTRDWAYAVLNPSQELSPVPEQVDAITFELAFDPGQESQVVVEYLYALGGYPDYDFDVKYGKIQYYLQPAASWKEFGSLTINLYLDEDMPVITDSSLPFEKVADRTYRYTSQGLPEEDLTITIDETGFQKFFSTLRSPYLWMTARILALPVLGLAGIILVVVLIVKWAGRMADGKKKE